MNQNQLNFNPPDFVSVRPWPNTAGQGQNTALAYHWRTKGNKAVVLDAQELVGPIASVQSRCFAAFYASAGFNSFRPCHRYNSLK